MLFFDSCDVCHSFLPRFAVMSYLKFPLWALLQQSRCGQCFFLFVSSLLYYENESMLSRLLFARFCLCLNKTYWVLLRISFFVELQVDIRCWGELESLDDIHYPIFRYYAGKAERKYLRGRWRPPHWWFFLGGGRQADTTGNLLPVHHDSLISASLCIVRNLSAELEWRVKVEQSATDLSFFQR